MHNFNQKNIFNVLDRSWWIPGKQKHLHKDIIKQLPETSGILWWDMINKQSLIVEVKVASCLSDGDLWTIKFIMDRLRTILKHTYTYVCMHINTPYF